MGSFEAMHTLIAEVVTAGGWTPTALAVGR